MTDTPCLHPPSPGASYWDQSCPTLGNVSSPPGPFGAFRGISTCRDGIFFCCCFPLEKWLHIPFYYFLHAAGFILFEVLNPHFLSGWLKLISAISYKKIIWSGFLWERALSPLETFLTLSCYFNFLFWGDVSLEKDNSELLSHGCSPGESGGTILPHFSHHRKWTGGFK